VINRKIMFRVVPGVLTIALIISLFINYTDYKKTQRENQYVQSLVHQFQFYVNQSAYRLGYPPIDYPRTSAEIAAAASELEDLYQYELMVNNQNSIVGYPPHADAIANFLSFISLSLINENTVYIMEDGTKYTINKQQAKKIILEIDDIFTHNINDNYTPPDKINSMFNQIYYKIIPGFVKNQLLPILDIWYLT